MLGLSCIRNKIVTYAGSYYVSGWWRGVSVNKISWFFMARLKCRKRAARKICFALQSSQTGCGNHQLNNYRTLKCHLNHRFFATASVRLQFEFHGIYGFELDFSHLLLRGMGSICSMCSPAHAAAAMGVQDPTGISSLLSPSCSMEGARLLEPVVCMGQLGEFKHLQISICCWFGTYCSSGFEPWGHTSRSVVHANRSMGPAYHPQCPLYWLTSQQLQPPPHSRPCNPSIPYSRQLYHWKDLGMSKTQPRYIFWHWHPPRNYTFSSSGPGPSTPPLPGFSPAPHTHPSAPQTLLWMLRMRFRAVPQTDHPKDQGPIALQCITINVSKRIRQTFKSKILKFSTGEFSKQSSFPSNFFCMEDFVKIFAMFKTKHCLSY